jgi:hypothetical protein
MGPKGEKYVTNAGGGPKPKRRLVVQPEQEVEYRTLTDLPVELCNEVRPTQTGLRAHPEYTSSESDILQLGRFESPSRRESQ